MALADESGEIEIWDLVGSRLLRRLTGLQPGLITAMTYSLDGSRLAAEGAKNYVKAWEVACVP